MVVLRSSATSSRLSSCSSFAEEVSLSSLLSLSISVSSHIVAVAMLASSFAWSASSSPRFPALTTGNSPMLEGQQHFIESFHKENVETDCLRAYGICLRGRRR